MGKIVNYELAEFVSKRIIEMIDLTGLTLESLATFVGLSTSTIRSAYKKSASMSIESLSKICEPFGVSLSSFFDFSSPLSIDSDKLTDLIEFKTLYFADKKRNNGVTTALQDYKKVDNHREQREFIASIIHSSSYFNVPKTIDQMIVDFDRDYGAVFSSERLYVLLLKYVGSNIIEKKAIPRDQRKKSSNKRPYLYFKKQEQ